MSASEQIWPAAGVVRYPSGWHVEVVETTGSTNADLLGACAAGAVDRTVLMAAHQTAGRGRLDRRWEAPPGQNLLVSLLFREVPTPAVTLGHRVALAARTAASRLAGVTPSLKWPNDLLLDGRKLAGVLAQRAPDGPVVVGIGVNLGWAPPDAIALGSQIAPPVMLRELLTAYDELPVDISELYRSALATLSTRVRVELPAGEVIEGTAMDVTPEGRLEVLDLCGVTHRLDVGDVIHVRDATAS